MLFGSHQISALSMLPLSSSTFSVYLFCAFHLLRGVTSESFYSPIGDPPHSFTNSTRPSPVTLSTSTLSLGSPRLSSQISVSREETTTKFCSGTGFACYMPAIPTSSALSTTSTNCSGTFYPFGVDYITETITEGEYITVSGNSSTLQPIYITPLPFCSTFSGRNIFAGMTQYSTRLVTKKTPILVQEPTVTAHLAFGSPQPMVASPSQIADTGPITSPQPVPSKQTEPPTTPPARPALGSIIASLFDNPPIPPQQTLISSEISQVPPQYTNPSLEIEGAQPGSILVSTLNSVAPGPSPSSIIINNVPVQVSPGSIVIGGKTISPATFTAPVTIGGQIFTISPSQVVAPGGIVLSIPASDPPAPTNAPGVVTIGGQQFTQIAPSQLQVSGSTVYIPPQGITAVVGGKTYTIYPSSIAGSGTTLALPFQVTEVPAAVELTAIIAAGLTFDLGPSEAVISGTTYEIGAGITPTAIVVGSATVTLGSAGVVLPSMTIAPLAASPHLWSSISADGLILSIQPGEVYISGTEYAIGKGATPTAVVVGGETVAIGTGGVMLPSTTIVPPTGIYSTWSVVSVDGLVFSAEPGEVYISGTEYAIGSGATPTTFVVGGETVAVGTNGIILPLTTIAAPTDIGFGYTGVGSRTCMMGAVSLYWGAVLVALMGGLMLL